MAKRRAYDSAAWRRLRQQVLERDPICVHCHRAPSTQADHIIEADLGGSDTLDNLVGSCAKCNGRRGQAYVTRKNQAKRVNQAPDPSRFTSTEAPVPIGASEAFGELANSPRRSSPSSLPDGPYLDEMPSTEAHSDLLGRIEPRLATPVLGASETMGIEVARWAGRILDLHLHDWQVRAVNDMLSVDDDGHFLFREALISTARQQGKTVLMGALCGWWASELALRRGQPQTCLIFANTLARSMATFRAICHRMEDSLGATVRIGNNSPGLTMPDGSQILPRAAKDNLHGYSLDLAVGDEVWDIRNEVIAGAVRPSMIARQDPLLALFSTAGDGSSVAMLQLRERALMNIDAGRSGRLYLAEWSLPPGVDPEVRDWWIYSNPTLGRPHGVTWDSLEANWQAAPKADFMRAHLNLWLNSAASWLPIGLWERQQIDRPMPAGGILSIDASIDDARFVGVRAVAIDGGCQVLTELVVSTVAELWREVERVMQDPEVKLQVTPGLDLQVPLPLRRRTSVVGIRELNRDTALVRSTITEGRVWHSGQSALSEHVTRAVAVKSNGALLLTTTKSPGPIELARCLVWSVAAASVPATRKRPAFAAS